MVLKLSAIQTLFFKFQEGETALHKASKMCNSKVLEKLVMFTNATDSIETKDYINATNFKVIHIYIYISLSIHLSTQLSVCIQSIHIYLFFLSIHQFIHLSIPLCIHSTFVSIYVSILLSTILSSYLSTYQSIYRPIYLSIHIFICNNFCHITIFLSFNIKFQGETALHYISMLPQLGDNDPRKVSQIKGQQADSACKSTDVWEFINRIRF